VVPPWCTLMSPRLRSAPVCGFGTRGSTVGGPHVFEESQFQRARQAVTDAVVPPHLVARVCGEGRCLLLVIILVGLGRAFNNSALYVRAVVRASVAGAGAAPLGWWHDARHMCTNGTFMYGTKMVRTRLLMRKVVTLYHTYGMVSTHTCTLPGISKTT
jgi:hypothetical protein